MRAAIGRVGAHIVAPLLVGAFLYLSFRSATLRVFDWLDQAGLRGAVHTLRGLVDGIDLPEPLVYSLPDALYGYAAFSCFALLWDDRPIGHAAPWLAMACVLGPGSELAQGLGVLPGTFDPLDLGFLLGAVALALIVHRPRTPFRINAPLPSIR